MKSQAAADPVRKEKQSKKRAASNLDSANSRSFVDSGFGEPVDGIQTDDDLNEPTMSEKLAAFNLIDDGDLKRHEKGQSSPRGNPPSADSVHVLLKQALRADDRALLLDCLYRQDEKVVANSISPLNPSDVFKLLESLISIIQSRGAVLACALPWLRSLLIQHASSITSQESSLRALNSLYQLIESRTSTFKPALQLSGCLDLLYAGVVEDGPEEDGSIEPIIYEDKDDSEDGSDESMETEGDDNEDTRSNVSDFDNGDDLRD